MENFEGQIRKYTFDELKREMEEEDLLMNTTLGLVVGGTMLDLMRLKKRIGAMPEFKLVYHTLTTAHLRIVKVEEWDKFVEWKKEKMK
ncbi:unnamed protein product [marine sediment metagenome]|uniref:Uncharacterized protein n=1 Tax=marine sediment metagenome TaxID=412755 RepID=X1DR49_9ZZZZ